MFSCDLSNKCNNIHLPKKIAMLACVCQPADAGIFRKSPIPLNNAPLQLNNKGAIPKPGKIIRIPVITREPSVNEHKIQKKIDDISTLYVDKHDSMNAKKKIKSPKKKSNIKQGKFLEKIGNTNVVVELNASLTRLDKINPIEREEIKDDPEACKRKEDDKELTRIPNELEKV